MLSVPRETNEGPTRNTLGEAVRELVKLTVPLPSMTKVTPLVPSDAGLRSVTPP